MFGDTFWFVFCDLEFLLQAGMDSDYPIVGSGEVHGGFESGLLLQTASCLLAPLAILLSFFLHAWREEPHPVG